MGSDQLIQDALLEDTINENAADRKTLRCDGCFFTCSVIISESEVRVDVFHTGGTELWAHFLC